MLEKKPNVALYLLLEPEWNALPLGVKLTQRMVSGGRLRSAQLILPDASVAPRHFSLHKRGGSYLVNAESSLSPTYLVEEGSDERVLLSPDAPRVLSDGSRLVVGELVLRVHLTEPPQEVEWLELQDLPKTLVKRALLHYGHPSTARDVKAALKELIVESDEDSPPPRRKLIQEEIGPAPLTSEHRGTLTLMLLLIGLVLALGALYWLLLPDTPRSL